VTARHSQPGDDAPIGSASDPGDGGRLTWLGHSTVLVELDGVRLLTDPVLRRRVLHLRRRAPLETAGLQVDAILVSHAHWDHLDTPTLDRLDRTTLVVLPRGAGNLLRRLGFTRVVELDEGETTAAGPIELRATHAEHDMARWPRRAIAPALGFVLEGSRRVYFAGDTDLFAGMADLADGLDLALLPVAGWGPTLPPGHLDPGRAAEALRLLRPRIAVPIHWGTYAPIGSRTAARAPSAPDEFLRRAGELAPNVDVRVLAVGDDLAF
jgi:L-ascorbate metabolism protein UlaG (beta-lactamase superfamily)